MLSTHRKKANFLFILYNTRAFPIHNTGGENAKTKNLHCSLRSN